MPGSGLDPVRATDAARSVAPEASVAGQAAPAAGLRQQREPSPELSAEQRAEVVHVAEDFNRAFSLFDIQARFSIHEATGEIIIDVIDNRSGEIIREIPPRELLDRYAQLLDILGLMVNGRA